MAILTTTRGFRYPENNMAPDIQRDIGNLAADIDAQYIESIASARPAAGIVGRRHRATDTGNESLDIGSAWVNVVPVDGTTLERSGGLIRVKDGSITAAKLASAVKPSGSAGDGDEAIRALGYTPGRAAPGVDFVAMAWVDVGAAGGFGFEPIESVIWQNVDPARPVCYMRHLGITYLRGEASFDGSSQPTPAVFQLPAGYWPPARMDWEERGITVNTNGSIGGGSSGASQVNFDGICFKNV